MTPPAPAALDAGEVEALLGERPATEPLGGAPIATLAPDSIAGVVEALRWAAADGVRVVPIGTGRHLENGHVGEPYALLTVAGLVGIETYEAADLTLTAAAGTELAAVRSATSEHGQWLPFDPPDVDRRTLGGLVAAGRTGPIAASHGALRNHVLGATVVTGDGRTLRLGGRVVKNVAGFDLLKPMVGSRGCLGVLTSATIRLFPVPSVDRLGTWEADTPASAVRVARTIATAPVLPASTVLVGGAGRARVVVRLQGSQAVVDADQRVLERVAGISLSVQDGPAHGGLDPTREAAWHRPTVATATTLPSRIDAVVAAAEAEGGEYHIDALSGSARLAFAEAVDWGALARRVQEAPGSLRVIHGPDGVPPSATDPEVELLEAGVKRVFDPGGVLRDVVR